LSASGSSPGLSVYGPGGFGFDDPWLGERSSSYVRGLYCVYSTAPNSEPGNKLKKMSVAYTTAINNPINQQFIADHFDMVLTGMSLDDAAYNIKQLNPEINILGYNSASFFSNSYSDWNYVSQNHEDWFVHDINGNRLEINIYPGTFLMNVSSGWKDYYAAKCVNFLDNHLQYSGIFSDNSNGELYPNKFTVPDDLVPQYVWDSWYEWMYMFIDTVYNAITEEGTNSKIFLSNSGKYYQYCEEITGYHNWEGYVHGRQHSLDSLGHREDFTLFEIDLIQNIAENGYIVSVISGTKMPDNPTSDELEQAYQWMIYCLCCYLFTVEDMEKSYFAWQFFGDDVSNGYYPEMDYPFGNPLNPYYRITGSVYARDFVNATVVANLSHDTPYTVNIDGIDYVLEQCKGKIIPTN